MTSNEDHAIPIGEKPMPLMRLPTYDALDGGARSDFARVEDIYAAASPNALLAIRSWLAGEPVLKGNFGRSSRAELEHALSPYMALYRSDSVPRGRSVGEMSALAELDFPPFARAASGRAERFVDCVERVARALLGAQTRFRDGASASAIDRAGTRIRYPDAKEISARMHAIGAHVIALHTRHPAFAAAIAKVALLNLHPYCDGNGRVSRVLFNWMAHGERDIAVYLPLHELASLSSGGFLLRLREAQYFNRWGSLAKFLRCGCERWLCVDNCVQST